ncbi:uncharacterized protein LOC127387383 isoform X2 [Apus apus]|uniref:uncharacterized protein LOC127387383 isoform X1 n=1 Tax=Apus apus TaxID=8895 RepID=UPI0021F8C8A7|nr:uncharacterized protein LOC127387383 isoform X1 [Apus apus]XP_051481604.1 uncharacterized protein LOC127387383 isoform X2 [Apus apus]
MPGSSRSSLSAVPMLVQPRVEISSAQDPAGLRQHTSPPELRKPFPWQLPLAVSSTQPGDRAGDTTKPRVTSALDLSPRPPLLSTDPRGGRSVLVVSVCSLLRVTAQAQRLPVSTMEFKTLLPILVCFSMGFLKPTGIEESSTPDWATAERKDLYEGPEQLPTGAESLFGEWLGSSRPDSPKSWVRVRAGVDPEAPEQLPGGTEGMASSLPYSLDQFWAFLAQEYDTQGRAGVHPEASEQLPGGTEAKASSLPYPLDQLWAFLAQEDQPQVTAGVAPGGPKQLPGGTEAKAWSLPFPLDQLWAYLTQPYTTTWLPVICETMFLHCLAGIARYIWRRVKKPQGQRRGRTATSPARTGRRQRGAVSRDHLELLRRLEINTALMIRHERLRYRRHLEELWRQLSRD